MKIQEIIDKLDLTKKSDYTNLESIASEFDIYEYLHDDDNKLYEVRFQKWLCTDTWVGSKVYMLEDEIGHEIVAISYQSARKSDEEFFWLSQEAFDKTKLYIYSLRDTSEDFSPSFVDFDYDYGDGFKLEYAGQLLTNELILDETGEIVEKIGLVYDKDATFGELLCNKIEVKLSDGGTKVVGMDEVTVPYCNIN